MEDGFKVPKRMKINRACFFTWLDHFILFYSQDYQCHRKPWLQILLKRKELHLLNSHLLTNVQQLHSVWRGRIWLCLLGSKDVYLNLRYPCSFALPLATLLDTSLSCRIPIWFATRQLLEEEFELHGNSFYFSPLDLQFLSLCNHCFLSSWYISTNPSNYRWKAFESPIA